MRHDAGLPAPARALVTATVLAGGVVLGVGAADARTWSAGDVVACLVLAAAIAVGELFQFEIPYRTERATYSVTDAIWTAALVLVRPSVLVVALCVGVVVGQSVQTWAPVKVVFNAGQFLLGIGAALLVYDAFDSPAITEPISWLAIGLAMGTFQAINTLLMAGVISLVEQEPFWRVALVPTGALHWVGNLVIGILGALLWVVAPEGLPLLLVPLVLTFLAYRGWLTTIEERDAMREIARTADGISRSGDVTTRLDLPSGQEGVQVLASTLNRMLDRLDASFQRERLFIRETSHELRTPITICLGHLELLAAEPEPAELKETRDLVVDELDRMSRIVEDMNTLARMEDPASLRREPTRVDELVADVVAKSAPLLAGRPTTASVPAGQTAGVDPQRLIQALINLVTNAVQHTPDGTAIDLRVTALPEAWRFEVADHGEGVPPGTEQEVFAPFCTGRSARPGNGLGLAIVFGIARAHGGQAGLDNRPGSGATFWLEVPR